MTPEAKKRYEELAKINAPTDLNFQCDDWKCCAKQSFNLGFHSGYQAGMQDPDSGKIVPTKSGSHVMVAKELWGQVEQERIANKELLDECEKLITYFYEITNNAWASDLLKKLKAARGRG